MSEKISSEEYDVFVKVSGDDDSTYKGLGCFNSESGLLHKGTRETKETECKNIGSNVEKSLKKIKYGSGTISYFFNPSDNEGKKVINDAFQDGTTVLTLKIEFDDMGATHPTKIERNVLVKEIAVEDDTDWKETATLELVGPMTVTGAD